MISAPLPVRWLLYAAHKKAVTLPPWGMYCLPGWEWLEPHERVHWQQYERMGFFKYYLTYWWYLLRYGYQNNPMEIEARKLS